MVKITLNELAFLVPIIIFRLGQSLLCAFLSLILLDLASILEIPYQEVSSLFLYKAAGCIIGALSGCLYLHFKNTWRFKDIDPISILGIINFINAIIFLAIPYINDLLSWKILVLIMFICFAFTETALTAIIIDTWGPVKSQSIMQGFHMLFAIGSSIGPVIVAPFLMARGENDDSFQIDKNENITQNLVESGDGIQNNDYNTLQWPFLIIMALSISSSILFFYIGLNKIRVKIQRTILSKSKDTIESQDSRIEVQMMLQTENDQKSLNSKENDQKTQNHSQIPVYWMLLATFLLYFGIGGSLHWYGDNIYSYATCALQWKKSLRISIQSNFWMMGIVAGLIGMYIINKIGAKAYVMIDTLIFIVCYILLCFLVESKSEMSSTTEILIISINLILGLAYGTIFAAGISWVAQDFLNVTQFYLIVFVIGDFAGQLPIKYAGKVIADGSVGMFFHIGLFYCFLIVIAIVMMNMIVRRYDTKYLSSL